MVELQSKGCGVLFCLKSVLIFMPISFLQFFGCVLSRHDADQSFLGRKFWNYLPNVFLKFPSRNSYRKFTHTNTFQGSFKSTKHPANRRMGVGQGVLGLQLGQENMRKGSGCARQKSCVWVIIEWRLMFIMFVYCAWKTWVLLSLCSASYPSNVVAFVGSGYVVRRQNDVRCVALK
jgi:hypothetical protein